MTNSAAVRELVVIVGYVVIGWFLAIKLIEPALKQDPFWKIIRIIAPLALLFILLGGAFTGNNRLMTRQLAHTQLLTRVMSPVRVIDQRRIDFAARVLGLIMILIFGLSGYWLARNGAWLQGAINKSPVSPQALRKLSVNIEDQQMWLCMLSAPMAAGEPWNTRDAWRIEEIGTFDPGKTIDRDLEERQFYIRTGHVEDLALLTDDQRARLDGAGPAHVIISASGVRVILDSQQDQTVPKLCGGTS
jgi:hypothetical protein